MNTEGSEPRFFCQICGNPFKPARNFAFGGKVCSRDCHDEYQWVKTLMIMGNKYYIDPRKENSNEPI